MQKLSMKDGLVNIFIDFRIRVQYETPALSAKQDRIRKQIQEIVNTQIRGFEEYCAEEMRKRPLPDDAVSQGMKLQETEKTLKKLEILTSLVHMGCIILMDPESYSRLVDDAGRKSLDTKPKKVTHYAGLEILVVDKPYPYLMVVEEFHKEV